MHTPRILIVTAVEVEREAVLRGIGRENERVKVIAAGVGPVTSAVQTTLELVKSENPFDLVIIAGVAGGFVGRAEVGHIVVADQIRSGDLGAESPNGFISIDELGFGSGSIEVEEKMTKRIYQTLMQAEAPVSMGPIITLNTTTGTAETAKRLAGEFPEARAEAMEGFGIATAARKMNIPVCEIRTISNLVGPRDRNAWKLKDALWMLEEAFAKCKEVL
ncbi:futalosine hydrolase [Croceifilum oryzae]|uniref:Futalosine hydrolase n=1 Tax=Croceifilum oryzae TaxID=1553429 RepID=A0AAJ1TEU2_9BACL|nr:futalosine hydrolase [Croceifilum oryzae]MDQ0417164.1 futalosine hydrolase [Croceifilum oryzae]